MKPAPFRYHRPSSVPAALDLLADEPDAKLLAGGQSLITLMNLRLARPAALVDIGRLRELARVFEDDGRILVGALLTHRDIGEHPVIARRHPLIADMVSHIGHVGIRNRGTLGGTLAHADPAAELPAAMLLLGARIHVDSTRGGRRVIDASDFFVAHFVSALEPDEMITWVDIDDLPPGTGWGFVEYAQRHGDYAIAGAAALVAVDDHGRPTRARAVVMNAGDRPILIDSALGPQHGELPTGDGTGDWERWAQPYASGLEPAGDDPDYLRDLTVQAVAHAASAAVGRVGTTGSSDE